MTKQKQKQLNDALRWAEMDHIDYEIECRLASAGRFPTASDNALEIMVIEYRKLLSALQYIEEIYTNGSSGFEQAWEDMGNIAKKALEE